MEDSFLGDIEENLASDSNGVFRKKLIEILIRYNGELTYSKQQFLTPQEHQIVVHMERAVAAALSVIRGYGPVKSDEVKNDNTIPFDNYINI